MDFIISDLGILLEIAGFLILLIVGVYYSSPTKYKQFILKMRLDDMMQLAKNLGIILVIAGLILQFSFLN